MSERAFARPGSDAPWQPSPADLSDSRLARFVRAAAAGGTSGGDDLESVQAHAVADPGWFWGATADDLELHWQRRPTTVLELAGGPARARWWV
ncbi:MAG: hypothetical protein M3P84_04770, partial [Chloroflexota bacterium]|nr:hypothetical protein [Chloroflexota bacterium]